MKLGTLVKIKDISEVDNAFKTVRDMGLESCQLVYKPEVYVREDALKIRAAADAAGIEISAQFCGYRDGMIVYDLYYGFRFNGLIPEAFRSERLKYLLMGAEFVQWLGITDMIIHAGYIPNNPFDQDYATLLSTISFLAKRCKSLGVNILFETGAESPVTLLRLITDVGTDNLFINLDTGNALMYGYANPVDALYTYGKYVRNIHAKDGVPPTDPRSLGKETAIGEGEVDFPAIMRRLKELGYNRYITIEREISGEQQKADIIAALNYLKSLLDEYGW